MNDPHTTTTYSYIFKVTAQTINFTIQALGTGKIASANNLPTLRFLKEINFSDEENNLSTCGKKYFETLFIQKNTDEADELIEQKIRQHPVVDLIIQVFSGKEKIDHDQLYSLLTHHDLVDKNITRAEITSLLILLNRYKIGIYDRKNKKFHLQKLIEIEEPVKQYHVSPDTPFTNICKLRQVLRSCKGDIFWIDKHFRKEGLEIIIDSINFKEIKSLTIISGPSNITATFIQDYFLLKQELSKYAVIIQLLIIDEISFKWHDRWIVSDNLNYNVPPILAIIQGQRADIIRVNSKPNINSFIAVSKEIEIFQKQKINA